MKMLFILALVAFVAGMVLADYQKRTRSAAEPAIAVVQQTTTLPTPSRSTTITKLVEPLYASVFGQQGDADLIIESKADVTAFSRLLTAQPVSSNEETRQILADLRLLCTLLEKAVDFTAQSRARLRANEAGRTINTGFFDSQIERKWLDGLAQLQSQAAPHWQRVQQLEAASAPAGGLLGADNLHPFASAANAKAIRLREAERAEAAELAAQAQTIRVRMVPGPSRAARVGLGGD